MPFLIFSRAGGAHACWQPAGTCFKCPDHFRAPCSLQTASLIRLIAVWLQWLASFSQRSKRAAGNSGTGFSPTSNGDGDRTRSEGAAAALIYLATYTTSTSHMQQRDYASSAQVQNKPPTLFAASSSTFVIHCLQFLCDTSVKKTESGEQKMELVFSGNRILFRR